MEFVFAPFQSGKRWQCLGWGHKYTGPPAAFGLCVKNKHRNRLEVKEGQTNTYKHIFCCFFSPWGPCTTVSESCGVEQLTEIKHPATSTSFYLYNRHLGQKKRLNRSWLLRSYHHPSRHFVFTAPTTCWVSDRITTSDQQRCWRSWAVDRQRLMTSISDMQIPSSTWQRFLSSALMSMKWNAWWNVCTMTEELWYQELPNLIKGSLELQHNINDRHSSDSTLCLLWGCFFSPLH